MKLNALFRGVAEKLVIDFEQLADHRGEAVGEGSWRFVGCRRSTAKARPAAGGQLTARLDQNAGPGPRYDPFTDAEVGTAGSARDRRSDHGHCWIA